MKTLNDILAWIGENIDLSKHNFAIIDETIIFTQARHAAELELPVYFCSIHPVADVQVKKNEGGVYFEIKMK